MPMKPKPGESQSDFMHRCVPEMINNGHPQDQAVAACLNMFHGKKDDGDKGMSGVVYKENPTAKQGDLLDFVLSDETPDRMGDVIRSDGWQLTNFKKNPIALFGHKSSMPIGTWKNIRIDKSMKALVATYQPAPQGSGEADGINKMVDAGVLKATSVGFRELESVPRKDAEGHMVGFTFTKQELVETSIVSVPANPAALVMAKELNISAATRSLVFREDIELVKAELYSERRLREGFEQTVKDLCDTVDRLRGQHNGWTSAQYYIAVRHLTDLADKYPSNELWRHWRDEMQRRALDFSRR